MSALTLRQQFKSMPVSRRVWWSGLAVLLLLIVMIVTTSWALRERVIDNWKRQMDGMTLVLAEQMSASLVQVSEALNDLTKYAEFHARVGDGNMRQTLSSLKTHQFLKDSITNLSIADVATFVGSNGDNINFSRHHPVKNINLSDRDYFRHHLAHAGEAVYVSDPVRNKGNGKWTFYLSRRIHGPDGSFYGVALVGVSIDKILAIHEKTVRYLGPHASISLFKSGAELKLISRWPFVERMIGQTNLGGTAHQILKVQGRSEGHVLTDSPRFSSGAEEMRLGTLRAVRGFPMHLLTVSTEDAYMAAWHDLAWLWGGAAFITLSLLLAALYWLVESLRKVEEALALMHQLQQEAQQASMAKSSFLATMSHEIRTPMNGILGMAQLLALPSMTEEERQKHARTILSSGRTLMILLNDILDHSKMEAGKLKLTVAPTAIEGVIEESKSLFEPLALARGLKLKSEWQGQPGAWYVMDGIRVRQMISNLVSNAIKFSEEGEICIVASELSRPDKSVRMLRFEVRDTGVGLSKAQQAQLFKPFSQVESSPDSRRKGTGLGLSTVKSLAKLMGGEVGVESERGLGATFWFTIRVHAAKDHEQTVLPLEVNPADMETATVLIAVDDVSSEVVLKASLDKWGYRYQLSENARQTVVVMTQQARPSLVLIGPMRAQSPEFGAIREMRAWESRQAAGRGVVLGLLASPNDAIECEGQEAGVDDWVMLPLNLKVLKQKLGHYFQNHR